MQYCVRRRRASLTDRFGRRSSFIIIRTLLADPTGVPVIKTADGDRTRGPLVRTGGVYEIRGRRRRRSRITGGKEKSKKLIFQPKIITSY